MKKEGKGKQFMKLTLVTLVISLCALTAFGQVREKVAAGTAASSSVGRNRSVVEEGTPGKHNLVTVSGRRLRPDCVAGAAMFKEMVASKGKTRDELDGKYQALLASEDCGYEFYRSESHNLVVNAGLNWLADIMGNTSTPAVNAQCNYIALTNTAITPGATDTTLSGEIVANGLARAQATYTHSANATTFTLAKTFTNATAPQAAQAGGVFTAASVGTLCYEDTFTAASLQIGDTLTVTWTITI